MAGRGRGRGKPAIALSGDQLGFGKTEVLPPKLQPPLNYPPLEYKPFPTNISSELRYLLQLKKDYAESMHDSPNNVLPTVVKKDIERYSDRYEQFVKKKKKSYDDLYDWSRMPAELKPQLKKRKADKTKEPNKKRLKEVDVETKLLELEKKESTQQSDAEEENGNEDDVEDKDMEDKIEDEEEEVDEEMDEGTDYVNNYFDNGEDYEDDEENLDDGAIF